jgi:epoxyqueuosine reductase
VTDLDLPADDPRPDLCGSCTACLEACPTGALVAPYVLDATRCISYLTIEVKGKVPEERREGVGRHVFGCDVCQDVCPWNRRRRHRGMPAFEPRPGAEAPDLAELAALDDDAFRRRFRGSPVKRAKRRGLLRNVALALGNGGDAGSRPILERLAGDADPVVREHAAWAQRRLDGRVRSSARVSPGEGSS